MKSKLPSFRSVAVAGEAPDSPEKLFLGLGGRAASHGYLRGPQQDVLRDYREKFSDVPDLALELPTGTGKTTVGLLLAEWKRLLGQKVAFLCLTNQLAGQVLDEAKRLGIGAADLRGTSKTRSISEEASYRKGAAVAVTTYSNLWNINPVVREAGLLIFDDAHGGEQFVSSMWSVSVKRQSDPDLFNNLLHALSPAMTQAQVAAIFDDTAPVGVVDQADVQNHPECIESLDVIFRQTEHNSQFSWPLMRPHLESCFFLVSAYEISIRPFISPTHTHSAFAQAKQRIYMSATLGDGSDLLRAYGLLKISVLRSPSAQWGRRYIFVPGLYRTEEDSYQAIGALWRGMNPQRAVLLSPSERILNQAYDRLGEAFETHPTRLSSTSISDTLVPFTSSSNVVLALAGRYDGLDLPDDQCRLLVMAGSPVAINLMERHLSERWKLTPLFRRRERTRLIQGMGRCTRNATDFALIFLMGQALADAATSKTFMDEFPTELAAELTWGIEQSQLASTQPSDFIEMALGLATDAEYRRGANSLISSINVAKKATQPNTYDLSASDEVLFSRDMWEGAYEKALETARTVADRSGGPDLAGYRAWWWYLASVASRHVGDTHVEAEALTRAAGTGINAAWLFRLLRKRKVADTSSVEINPLSEGLWTAITDWGWSGPGFASKMQEMRKFLASKAHVDVHQGMELLGRCYGARTLRPTTPGSPDVAWLDVSQGMAFEAKTEKKADGSLYKKDLQEAKGHPEWLRHYERLDEGFPIRVIIISPTKTLDEAAVPFASDVFVVSPEAIAELADSAISAVQELRTKYLGREFTEVAAEFAQGMKVRKLLWDHAESVLSAEKLTPSA